MITQLATVKARLGIDATDFKDDTLLTQFINWVGARFDNELNRTLARAASQTYEFSADSRRIIPPLLPIESVSALALKNNEDDGWVTQTGISYVIQKGVVIYLQSALGTENEQGRITYTGGYVMPGDSVGAGQTALPKDLEQSATEQVCYLYQQRERLGLTSVSGPGGSISQYSKLDLLPTVAASLAPYVRMLL
jgi:hypothetical protein